MRLAITLLLVGFFVCANSTEPNWKPKEGESQVVGDPRFDAVRAYRDADVVLRVHTYLKRRIQKPGDEADLLLNDFQPTTVSKLSTALDFLEQYPDDDFSSRIIRFQVESTSGPWAPWKILALLTFKRAPKAFQTVFASLSADSRSKLVLDVAMGIDLATNPRSEVIFRLSKDDAERLTKQLQQYRQSIK